MYSGIHVPAAAHLCFSFFTSTLGFLGGGGLESDESFLTKGNICLILKQIHSQTVKKHQKCLSEVPQKSNHTTTMNHNHSLTSIFTLANLSILASSECLLDTLLSDESFLQKEKQSLSQHNSQGSFYNESLNTSLE